jgi:hypothetical protein
MKVHKTCIVRYGVYMLTTACSWFYCNARSAGQFTRAIDSSLRHRRCWSKFPCCRRRTAFISMSSTCKLPVTSTLGRLLLLLLHHCRLQALKGFPPVQTQTAGPRQKPVNPCTVAQMTRASKSSRHIYNTMCLPFVKWLTLLFAADKYYKSMLGHHSFRLSALSYLRGQLSGASGGIIIRPECPTATLTMMGGC